MSKGRQGARLDTVICDGRMEVVDVPRQVVIFASSDFDEARRVYRLLKRGAGFRDWTPQFMSEQGLTFQHG